MAQALAPARSQALAFPRGVAHPLMLGAAFLLAMSLLLRSALIGDPFAGYDEQFYLLTGARMLHGAVPYIDIWDRKPIGLFLIYAFAASLGGTGVIAYQVLAALSVAATGFVVARFVARSFPWPIGLACGFLYIVWVSMIGGQDGQSPLFYNLPMAGAALLVRDALAHPARPGALARACGAMALCGIALTIKTTVIFESCCFGLALVLGRWHATGDLRRTAPAALAFMVLGALPFAAAIAWYAAIGHLEAFWFANATSAALRRDGWTADTPWYLLITIVPLAPLMLLGLAGRAFPNQEQPAWERRFLLAWTCAALLGFASVGYFYQHYALPLLVPFCIAAAPFLAGWRRGWWALVLVTAMPVAMQLTLNRYFSHRERAQAAAIVAAIPDSVRTRCMLVYGGPPVLYQLTQACLVSRFAFPNHFYSAGEAPAIGVDQVAALRAALARDPQIVTTEVDPFHVPRNPRADAVIAAELARHYRVRAIRTHQFHENDLHVLTIWERK